MALITGAAVLVGVVLFVLLVVRPGAHSGGPTSSGNPYGFTYPAVQIPADLVDGQSLGKKDAPVTMDIYADYQCPYCGLLATQVEPQIISNLVLAGKVRIVAHDFSFIGEGNDPDESTEAAVAARCAGRQGKFWDFYEMLYWNQPSKENSGGFVRDRLKGMADVLKLDRTGFDACLDDPTVKAAVQNDTAQGRALKVQSTPTSFINGELVLGVKDYNTFASMIEAAAKASGQPTASPTAAPSTAAP